MSNTLGIMCVQFYVYTYTSGVSAWNELSKHMEN